jgi:hypothetical protein
MKNGGKRPGAGRPKGTMSAKARTLLEVKDRIAKTADSIVSAQMAEAKGTHLVYRLNPITKKYELVRDENEILECINNYQGLADESLYIITTNKPDVKAGQYLLDRAFGKPEQTVSVGNKDGEPFKTEMVLPKLNDSGK